MTGETITVEARFTAQGEITPRGFEWQGRMLTVEAVGRRWAGPGERRFTVLAMGGRLFELRLDEQTLCWSMVRGPVPRLAV